MSLEPQNYTENSQVNPELRKLFTIILQELSLEDRAEFTDALERKLDLESNQ